MTLTDEQAEALGGAFAHARAQAARREAAEQAAQQAREARQRERHQAARAAQEAYEQAPPVDAVLIEAHQQAAAEVHAAAEQIERHGRELSSALRRGATARARRDALAGELAARGLQPLAPWWSL